MRLEICQALFMMTMIMQTISLLSPALVQLSQVNCCIITHQQSSSLHFYGQLLVINLHTKHQIDWDSATCITYFTDYYQRLTLKSWFTNLEQMPLDRSQQLPAPYKRLIDEIKET